MQKDRGIRPCLGERAPKETILSYLVKNRRSFTNFCLEEDLSLGTRVSVVIPAYNEARVIVRVLQALEKQTSRNFEVIVVDNGSEDNTSQVTRSYSKRVTYPLFLISETNPGVAYARRRGMDEVLRRLVRRNRDFHHAIAVTDADTVPPRDWIVKIGKGFKGPKIGGLAGTHEASEEVEKRITDTTGIKNYFNIVPTLIEFLVQKGFGQIKMSGPNSAFDSVAYVLGGGIKQEFDPQGRLKLSEVNNLGNRIRESGYVIAPMRCRVVKDRRRELFEIVNNGEDSYFPEGYHGNGRFNAIRENEQELLGIACQKVPRETWENYRYKMINKVIMNFVFRPLVLGGVTSGNIQELFTPREIEFFSASSGSLQANRYSLSVLDQFFSRLESKLKLNDR